MKVLNNFINFLTMKTIHSEEENVACQNVEGSSLNIYHLDKNNLLSSLSQEHIKRSDEVLCDPTYKKDPNFNSLLDFVQCSDAGGPDGIHTYVALTDENKIASYAKIDFNPERNYYKLRNLYTFEEYRCQGYAKCLISYLIHDNYTPGMKIEVTAAASGSPENDNALSQEDLVAFYKGFTVIKENEPIFDVR